jgi:hypothetical protein
MKNSNETVEITVSPTEIKTKATGNIARTLGTGILGITCLVASGYTKNPIAKTVLTISGTLLLGVAIYESIQAPIIKAIA